MMASTAPLNLDKVIDNQSVWPTTILFLAIAILATKVGTVDKLQMRAMIARIVETESGSVG